MEFSTAASAVTFIVLAAQLSKILYTTFDSIKDGPANVQAVAGEILRFHGALEQLKGCPMVANDLGGPIRACYLDLEPLAVKIRGLQLKPAEKKSGKLWKRFKCFLSEKKLDQIRTQVNVLTNDIHLRLNILQSFIVDRISSDVRLTNQSIGEAGGKIDQLLTSQVSSFATIDQSLQSFQSSQQKDLQTGLSSIQDAVKNAESIRQADANCMLDLMRELKSLMLSQNRTQQDERAASPSDGSREDYDQKKKNLEQAPGFDDNLVTSITKLCSLIEEKEQSFNTDADDDPQAESIIKDMQSMIRSAQDYAEAKQGKTGVYSDLRRFDKSFGQVKLLLNPGNTKRNMGIATSELDTVRNEGNPGHFVVPRKRKYACFELGDLGTVTLMTSKRKRLSDSEDDNSTWDTDRGDCKSAMWFLPKDFKKLSMLVAYNIRQGMPGYAGESISSLAVNRVLPAGSQVFRVVKLGQLHELKDMLHRGEASLRDHDEYGASLLCYATKQPEMCRFLLSNGLDVDHVVSRLRTNKSPGSLPTISDLSSILEIGCHDLFVPKEEFNEVIECRRLLLEAGADPAVDEGKAFLHCNLTWGHLESIQSIWGSTLIQPFAHINHILPEGNTPFLLACSNKHAFNKEMFSFLLNRGANIKARDLWGRTCLHFCLSVLLPSHLQEQYEAIKFLIKKGADVDARDDDGVTVHEAAYAQGHSEIMGEHIGSLAGDLWDSILESCGYDISKFRQEYQRRAVYCGDYTRQSFKELWKGRESHCPYWDDTPWPEEAPWRPYKCTSWCKAMNPNGYFQEIRHNNISVYEMDSSSDDGSTEELYSESDSHSVIDGAESENEATQDEVFLAGDNLVPSNAFDSPFDTTVLDSIDDIDDASSCQSAENGDEFDSHFYVNADNPDCEALYQNPWSD
ncbi:ankyrin [Xylaria scruposa]|nr:ankyrin [Xylaria scruposa]